MPPTTFYGNQKQPLIEDVFPFKNVDIPASYEFSLTDGNLLAWFSPITWF